MGVPQGVGGIDAALKSYNSSSDRKNVASEKQAITRNMSFIKAREMSQAQPPYSLSRSLGPLQGTSPLSQFRSPTLPCRGSGSDTLDNLVALSGTGEGAGGRARKRPVNTNAGFLVASSPPRSNNIGQKVGSDT